MKKIFLFLFISISTFAQQDSITYKYWVEFTDKDNSIFSVNNPEYFLSQRIKPENPDNDNYNKYVNLTIICQKIIFTSMKTKQTVDIKYVDELKMLIELLIQKYFDDHGFNHLKLLRNK